MFKGCIALVALVVGISGCSGCASVENSEDIKDLGNDYTAMEICDRASAAIYASAKEVSDETNGRVKAHPTIESCTQFNKPYKNGAHVMAMMTVEDESAVVAYLVSFEYFYFGNDEYVLKHHTLASEQVKEKTSASSL